MKLENKAYVAVAEFCKSRVLKRHDILAVVKHLSRVGAFESAYYLQQSCLSRSAGAHNRHYFALHNVEVYVGEHLQVAVAL